LATSLRFDPHRRPFAHHHAIDHMGGQDDAARARGFAGGDAFLGGGDGGLHASDVRRDLGQQRAHLGPFGL
jgi:hypothetical protein